MTKPPAARAKAAHALLTEAGFSHFLEPGTVTWRRRADATRCAMLDLVLGNLRAEEKLVSCAVDKTWDCNSDHLPIRFVLNLTPSPTSSLPHLRFSKTNIPLILSTYTPLANARSSFPLDLPSAVELATQ